MTTTYTTTIDWPALHAAMTELDEARRSAPGLCLGHDGVSDALGGTYYGPEFERQGVAGLASLRTALSTITQAAWTYTHDLSVILARRTAGLERDGWCAHYAHGATMPLARQVDGSAIVFRSERAALAYAQAHTPKAVWALHLHEARGYAMAAADVRAYIEAEIIEEARACVRTMLAARPVFDLLCAAGLTSARGPENHIPAGYDDHGVHLTGLRWLAGKQQEHHRIPVEAARAFAAGGSLAELVERREVLAS
jgi:hypothetical protein